MPKAIKEADTAVLLRESETILKAHPAPWCIDGTPAKVGINCWTPERAERLFLSRFYDLAGQ